MECVMGPIKKIPVRTWSMGKEMKKATNLYDWNDALNTSAGCKLFGTLSWRYVSCHQLSSH